MTEPTGCENRTLLPETEHFLAVALSMLKRRIERCVADIYEEEGRSNPVGNALGVLGDLLNETLQEDLPAGFRALYPPDTRCGYFNGVYVCNRLSDDLMHTDGCHHRFQPVNIPEQSKDSAAGSIPASLDGGAQQIEAAGPRPGSPASVSMREQIDAALKDPDSELSRFLTAYDEADRASHYHVPSPEPVFAWKALAAIKQALHTVSDDVRAKLLDLHRPYAIYEECDHDHDGADGAAIYVDDVGLTCNKVYDTCRECCTYGGEGQNEVCVDGHNHGPNVPRCATVAILNG